MYKDVNDWLALGIFILVIGLGLSVYSVASYFDLKELSKKVDFELVDDNLELSNLEKYYEYLSFSEYLDRKLTKNKNIIVKNSSCVYLDYAQHNAVQLYRLTNKMNDYESAKRSVAAGKIRSLYNMLDNYKTCSKSVEYKTELQLLLDDIQKTNESNLDSEERMKRFMGDSGLGKNSKEEQMLENVNVNDIESQDIKNIYSSEFVQQKTQVQIPSEESVTQNQVLQQNIQAPMQVIPQSSASY